MVFDIIDTRRLQHHVQLAQYAKEHKIYYRTLLTKLPIGLVHKMSKCSSTIKHSRDMSREWQFIPRIWIFQWNDHKRELAIQFHKFPWGLNGCLLGKATLSRTSHLHEEYSFKCHCYKITSSVKKLMKHKARTILLVKLSYEVYKTSLLNRCAIRCINISPDIIGLPLFYEPRTIMRI